MCSKKLESTKKLSLVAHFDDLCRLSNSLIVFDENEYIELIKSMENMRIEYHSTNNDLKTMKQKYNILIEKYNVQQTTIKHLRYSLAKQFKISKQMKKERDDLYSHLEKIRNYILENSANYQNKESHETMLTYIHRMEPLVEVSHSSGTDDDIDDVNASVEFDKTEEEDEHYSKFISLNDNIENIENVNEIIEFDKEVKEDNEVFDCNPTSISSLNIKQNRSQSEPIPVKSNSYPSRNSIKSDSATILNNESVEQIENCCEQLESNITFVNSILNDLDKKVHHFQKKKAFKPEKCVPCAKKIGFCGDCLKCCDCFATCHLECQHRVPIPCIPFNKQNYKHIASLLIADYVPENSYLAIPSQLIHLCTEIEKRALDQEVYRIPAPIESVEQLYKDMFVKPKKSMLSLESIDLKVLCGVLKKFLSSLNEPLVTKILWRDFVRAAEQTNIEDECRLMKQAINVLPKANSHTLAFLILHFKRIAKSSPTKMDYKKLAAIFGPIVVGHSEICFPNITNSAEFALQIKVMESLCQINEDFWNLVVSTTPTQRISLCNSTDVRQSLGTRLFSGVNVQKGTLSPQRASRLKPLF